MKATTKEWLIAAEDDLLSAEKLAGEARLTNIVAFHCQQCIEKSLKGLIEELNLPSIKSHDLIRLLNSANIKVSHDELTFLEILNEVYIDARYPADLGLMPDGKPTIDEAMNFINFTKGFYTRIKESFT